MDFLLESLEEIAAEIFGSVAHLLNLDLDIIFVDATSTYWEVEVADELVDLGDDVDDDGIAGPVQNGARAFGHSKDHRTDLPQVVIAMAVTRDGVPVRCWTFPGNTADTSIIRTVKDDLAGWNLHRMVWVADRGFASAANRAYLTRGGGHYIHAEKLRHTNTEAAAALARPGRYRTVAGNLRVKEVTVAPGGAGDGDQGARAQRFVVCHNPEQGDRDAVVRDHLVAHLEQLMAGSDSWTERRRDEFVGSLKTKPGVRRYLRRTSTGLLRIDAAAIKAESHLDGKWLLRTSDSTLTLQPLSEGVAADSGRPVAVNRVRPNRYGLATAVMLGSRLVTSTSVRPSGSLLLSTGGLERPLHCGRGRASSRRSPRPSRWRGSCDGLHVPPGKGSRQGPTRRFTQSSQAALGDERTFERPVTQNGTLDWQWQWKAADRGVSGLPILEEGTGAASSTVSLRILDQLTAD